MTKKLLIAGLSLLICLCLFIGCSESGAGGYSVFTPDKTSGDSDFEFPSNSFSADVVMDGVIDDERWQAEDVVTLGSWDNTDVESGQYGAVVNDTANYAETKRMIIKMFRGEVGLHFGFEVKDDDLQYLKLEDGDSAIWTDNVLVNLCTAMDGGTVPMSDDYYFIVTAFGNNCFRRGANAAGMWGAWSGVLDYEASIDYAEDGVTAVGFGVELVVPYAQIGISKNSPVGVTFRSCDRVGSLNAMVEREWWFMDDVHLFNTPNSYVVWGADNALCRYYDYAMPAVTVRGTAVDYISGEALSGITVNGDTVTDANGNFELNDVNANVDLSLSVTGDSLLSDQTFSVSRDSMRVLNGGVLTVTPKFLTKKNKITQTVSGTVTSIGTVAGTTVKIGDSQTTVNAEGFYSLDCTFGEAILKMEVKAANSDSPYETEIAIDEAMKGAVTRDIELPVMSSLTNKFGAAEDIETQFGWTSEGLFVRMAGKSATNGYGVALSADGVTGKVILYHSFGTMCITDFVTQSWNYALPASYGITADQHTDIEGRKIYTFVIPYENLGITAAQAIKIAPFEYTAAGPFAWYKDENGKSYQFGNADLLAQYPTLGADATITVVKPDTTLSEYSVAAFGKTGATALFEKIDGATSGIRVTVTYTAQVGFWGFGIMFEDTAAQVGVTQLYVPGYGTIDHRIYGNWAWNGNYVAASALGVEAAESSADGGKTVITLFYSYQTLQSAGYGLNISAQTDTIGIQMFEYVTDATGNLYGCYNCINDEDGNPIPFDSYAGFVVWDTIK